MTTGTGRTGRTRVRSKRIEPAMATPTTVDELVVGAACCVPTVMGTFKNEVLVRLERRHMGRFCAGQTDPMDIKKWRSEGGLR